MSNEKYCPDCAEPVPPSGRCDCGWRSKSKQEFIEPYPEMCCVKGCENDTTQSFAFGVYRGVTIMAYGGQFLYNNGKTFAVRQDCEFIRWATRCNECYLREADVRGITRFKTIETELEIQKANPPSPKTEKNYAEEIAIENKLLEGLDEIYGEENVAAEK